MKIAFIMTKGSLCMESSQAIFIVTRADMLMDMDLLSFFMRILGYSNGTLANY
jgi:hypothetical protein